MAEDVPVMGGPSVEMDERTLLRIEELGDAAAKTQLRFEATIRRVRGDEWKAVLFVPIVRARTTEIVTVVQSAPLSLPIGDSTFSHRLKIDAEKLAPGAYVLFPTLVAAYGEPITDFENAIEVFQSDERPAAVFVAAPDEPLTVLDSGEEAIRSYRATIASGNPTAIVKGLSALIGHYRMRGQYGLAQEAVSEFVRETSSDPGLDKLHPIARFWNVDDRRLAGDDEGAITLLEDLLEETPDGAHFLGEPFRGRGLIELARLHVGRRDFRAAQSAYTRVLDEFPTLERHATLIERAHTHLELQEWGAALADFQQVVTAFETCGIVVEAQSGRAQGGSAPCPTSQQSELAERQVLVLESDRAWFRSESEELVAVFEQALETRDIAVLDAIANPVSMRFVAGAGEWDETLWDGLLRGLMAKTLESSPNLRLRLVEDAPTRRTLTLEGVAEELSPGPLGRIALTLDETPLGWQWGGVNVVPIARRAGDEDWDPCPIDIEAGETECPGQGGGGPRGGGGPPRPRRYLDVQAPWSAGTHMRAGGLHADGDFSPDDIAGLGLDALRELALNLSVITGRCGAGVPGYYYGLDTHTDEDFFAIDYMKGSVLFCVWGACVAPPGAVFRELVEIAADSGEDFGPTKNAAFDQPLLAAHEGLVLDANFTYPDGDTDGTHANRVDIAVWENSSPPDLGQILHDLQAVTGLGALLRDSGADFWLENLHLRQRCRGRCPSRGMWVAAGQEIGRIDDTGKSFTSHLHFVVHGRPVEADAGDTTQWLSTMQMIDGDLLVGIENSKCIKSKNEFVENDSDGDDIFDHLDNCVVVDNPDQADVDRDGIGDICDPDRDNDGILNPDDSCPEGAQQDDFDGDGTPDACDDDSDGDGVPEGLDRCPFFDDSLDFDNDSIPDLCDDDADADGFSDGECEDSAFLACGCLKDLFPTNRSRAGDHDADGRDSLSDDCPCSDFNPTCEPELDIPPKGWGDDLNRLHDDPPGGPPV